MKLSIIILSILFFVTLANCQGTCGTEFFCTDDTACQQCYALNMSVCYEAKVYLESSAWVKNDLSLSVYCEGIECYLNTYSDGSCQTVDYSTLLQETSQCNSCYGINGAMTFEIQGTRIYTYALSTLESEKQIGKEIETLKVVDTIIRTTPISLKGEEL
ncbi:hypothetical protein PPL_02260 [Heterostelium album PN500]|uniref:Uncharacterized protein n=1 Tax=Heterostelium pallidum (strain ATCC 26659 / Pp 5 / PN500) TaxID=670386 RepID=D3B1T6_HETP5|nr:hypothetical protein PPL_02260 [Heterostelium album PN500]EFA85260.1 hypothetical protein PPL_02260 [Heterostelium album PN500]|eukprot:XP_020437369.1 hypothetical protein PPL_02260 [Heterostelium album PN500]